MVLICISLITNDAEHLFSAVCISSFVNCLYKFLTYFSVVWPVFFLLICKSF